ncbi:MAG: hypothetical protein RTU92_03750 [Candidatus Thorarchaeota archaeon]
MPKRARIFSFVLIVLMMGVWIIPQSVEATTPEASDTFTPKLYAFDVDEFTYRISFVLADDTEVLLIRAKFGMIFLSQERDPPVSQHFMTALVGFYYGKTMLGRSLIQSMNFDSIGYYAIWQDIALRYHDFVNETGLFELTDTVRDGQMVGGTQLIDPQATSRFIHLMGGTMVIRNLSFTMSDGSEILVGDMEIKMTKHYNENKPYAAVLETEENLTYSSDTAYLTITSSGIAPVILTLDLVLGYTLIGGTAALIILMILQLKGKISLPFSRITRLVARQPAS